MKKIEIPISVEGKEVKIFQPKYFASVIKELLSPKLEQKIKDLNIKYVGLTPEERDRCIAASIRVLLDPEVDKSGEQRLGKWEKSWSENLSAIEKGEKRLLPYYFQEYGVGRWMGEYIKPLEKGFDYKVLSIILDWLFEKYIADVGTVYEFGCGTGHNLLRAREFNPEAKIFGLDWTEVSQKIISEMAEKGIVKNTFGKRFDFFNPDPSFYLEKNSAVYTVSALEQVGDRHENFINYLLKQKPRVVFHAEPIEEFLDENNLLDFLTKKYYEKRNYLKGFLTKLKSLEKGDKIEILKAERTYLAGDLIMEYMVVAWAPKA
jgi:SAM-dependent methyltransferase